MIKTIAIIIVIIATIFLLLYYNNSSKLELEDKGVTIEVNKQTLFIEASHLKMRPITFSNLTVFQTKLSNGTYYEVATCDSLYEFNHNTKHVIRTIFEAKKIDELFNIGGVHALRVTLKNRQVINMFVHDNDGKTLKIFYGIPFEEYSRSVKKIMGKTFQEFSIGGMFELPTAMTKWNEKHNNFDGVIQSIDY